MRGKPNCPTCGGRGSWRDAAGWRKCHCTRPSQEQAALLRVFNARDGLPFRLPNFDVGKSQPTK